MERQIYSDLLKWKYEKNKKPLIFTGTRQVGKTYILKEFGKREYKNTFHFDFDREREDLLPLFERTINPKKIIQNLSILREKSINIETDLIIFDEIQISPRALTSLKYFSEDYSNASICAAGSLLGLSLGSESYPVGKISYLTMYPMTFLEFLINDGSKLLVDQFKMGLEKKKIEPAAHKKLLEKLHIYYVIGGLPEVVAGYIENKGDIQKAFEKSRIIQKNLIRDYTNDFTKHAGKLNALHIQTVFHNIPLQLATSGDYSVSRYKFKDIIRGKKGFGVVEAPISWLEKAGLIIKIHIANYAETPLLNFCKENIFKLYMFDIGILGTMLGIEPKSLILDNYGITKGFFVENYCLQEILASGEEKLISWNERNAEIEYVFPFNQEIIPVEIKSGKRTKSKSLASFRTRYNPKYAIKLTTKELNIDNSEHINIPLYYAGYIKKLISTE